MNLKRIDHQALPTDSPWTLRERIFMLLWEYVWVLFCLWTPKPANFWRLYILKLFGASIEGKPFVHQRARIQKPWKLTLKDHSCIGDRANLYSLGEIELGAWSTVAQEAYLCTGTHDFYSPSMALVTGKITIGAKAFVGARSFILPGVTVGDGAIVGACSVVTKDVAINTTVAGNPARVIYPK